MSHGEMTQWVLTQIIEGLCQGKPLARIAGDIVTGISNITASNLKDAQATKDQQ